MKGCSHVSYVPVLFWFLWEAVGAESGWSTAILPSPSLLGSPLKQLLVCLHLLVLLPQSRHLVTCLINAPASCPPAFPFASCSLADAALWAPKSLLRSSGLELRGSHRKGHILACGPIQPATLSVCFFIAHELTMGFTVLKGWGESQLFPDTWKLCKIQISVSINKVLLEHGMHIWLWIVNGCLFMTPAELSRCLAQPKILFYRKSLLIPSSELCMIHLDSSLPVPATAVPLSCSHLPDLVFCVLRRPLVLVNKSPVSSAWFFPHFVLSPSGLSHFKGRLPRSALSIPLL